MFRVSVLDVIFLQLLPGLVAEAEELGNDDKLVSMYGWVVSINPLGQVIFSPLLGYLNNKTNSARPALLISGVLVIVSNTLYSVLSIFPEDSRYALLLLSRFITGCAGGKINRLFGKTQNIYFQNLTGVMGSVRAYVASATTREERPFQLTMTFAVQSIGLVLGPALSVSFKVKLPICKQLKQKNVFYKALFAVVQCSEKVAEGGTYIALDMYTVPG